MAQSKRVSSHLVEGLFPKSSFRLGTLSREQAKSKSDDLAIFRELLLANEPMYPGINRWYSQKVVPGLLSGERIGHIAYEGEKPIASAVLKLGSHAKFCHLRIHEDFQDHDLGQFFFAIMALEARHSNASEIHFTLPEGLWNRRSTFFKSFGFQSANIARQQYRNGEIELACSAPWKTVWANSLSRLPYLMQRFSPGGYSSSSQILLSMQADYATRVFESKKRIEIRRRFSTKWKGCKAAVYGSRPVSALMGEVTIADIIAGPPAAIWEKFGEEVGCSYEEFRNYVGDSKEIYALALSNVTPYIAPVDLHQVSHLISRDLTPPQSFLNIENSADGSWAVAISVAGLLNGKHSTKSPRP